jgi:hypothetical protein
MELSARRVQSFFVGFSIELLQTAQRWECPHPLEFPCVFPHDRIPFDTWNPETGERKSGAQPTHASVLVFVVSDVDEDFEERLREEFEEIGYVHMPRSWG